MPWILSLCPLVPFTFISCLLSDHVETQTIRYSYSNRLGTNKNNAKETISSRLNQKSNILYRYSDEKTLIRMLLDIC